MIQAIGRIGRMTKVIGAFRDYVKFKLRYQLGGQTSPDYSLAPTQQSGTKAWSLVSITADKQEGKVGKSEHLPVHVPCCSCKGAVLALLQKLRIGPKTLSRHVECITHRPRAVCFSFTRKAWFPRLVHLTNICQLWILATSWNGELVQTAYRPFVRFLNNCP